MEEIVLTPLTKVAQIEVSYRNHVPAHERSKIFNSRDAEQILRASWDENKIQLVEQFKVLLMDTSNSCLGIFEVGSGGISSVSADPRIIFPTALIAKASRIILAHNHPSGNGKASDADIKITRKLKEAGKFLDIDVLDHQILTADKYVSLADEGLMPD
jgi:DNA repair protein RadC